jgi:hypothetical protein
VCQRELKRTLQRSRCAGRRTRSRVRVTRELSPCARQLASLTLPEGLFCSSPSRRSSNRLSGFESVRPVRSTSSARECWSGSNIQATLHAQKRRANLVHFARDSPRGSARATSVRQQPAARCPRTHRVPSWRFCTFAAVEAMCRIMRRACMRSERVLGFAHWRRSSISTMDSSSCSYSG